MNPETDNAGSTFRSGYVAIIGLPNAGKSTFLNHILSETLAIVTPKPQTTRDRITGIYHTDQAQVIFLDTPGLCRSASKLNERLNREVFRALGDADLILFLVDVLRSNSEAEDLLATRIARSGTPAFLVFNKIDKLANIETLMPRQVELMEAGRFETAFSISATKGTNVDRLMDAVLAAMPFGPAYYPDDQISTANMRFLAAEMIRRQVFLFTEKELPYATAVTVQNYTEPKTADDLLFIEADIVVEKDSQKGIIIGAKGSMLKKIGQAARVEIEEFTETKVFLKLFVKVRKNWTHNENFLKDLGYT
jgi:GTPase